MNDPIIILECVTGKPRQYLLTFPRRGVMLKLSPEEMRALHELGPRVQGVTWNLAAQSDEDESEYL